MINEIKIPSKQFQKSNAKIKEGDKINTPNTHIHDRTFS